MSITFSLSHNSSVLTSEFNPSLYLDDDEYEKGLASFESFNVIPDIDETNNQFDYTNGLITIPAGAYEITDLTEYITNNKQPEMDIEIKANNNTLTVNIIASRAIDFSTNNIIGSVLGFKNRILEPHILHTSDFPVEIIRINALCIDFNIATGSFFNRKPSHIIHQFFPTVSPGYKRAESPLTILYFPVSYKTINSIVV